MRNALILIGVVVAIGVGIFVSSGAESSARGKKSGAVAAAAGDKTGDVSASKKKYDKPADMKIDKDKTYTATIETDAGTMVAELYPKLAPETVNSFVFLAKEKFYDGTIFHRVIPGFMIQGGDPTGTGTGGPGYSVKAEFSDTKHDRGILSMARTDDPDSAGSQFFVVHARAEHLDGKYTVFGKVTKGLEVIDKIVNAPKDANDRPEKPVAIKTIKIEEK